MLLSMDVLLAPREVRVGRISGTAVAPANGMTAGLKRANFFARLLLFSTLETLHKALPRAGPRSYVDDLTQLVTGDKEEVIQTAVTGAWMLYLALQRLKVKISTKSAVAGCNVSVAREVAKRIQDKCGLILECTTQATDLGVDCGGSRRCLAKTNEREQKADLKLGRIQYLGSLNKSADKLVGSGADPQRAYGHEVYGTAPTRLAKWRTRNGEALHFAKSCCLTTAYAFRKGTTDPAIRARRDQIILWCQVWGSTCAPARTVGSTMNDELQVVAIQEQLAVTRTKRAWSTFCENHEDWRNVCGPMGATVTTLREIGWSPIKPDEWSDENGVIW